MPPVTFHRWLHRPISDGSGTRRVVQILTQLGVTMVSEDPETYDIHGDLMGGWPPVVTPVLEVSRWELCGYNVGTVGYSVGTVWVQWGTVGVKGLLSSSWSPYRTVTACMMDTAGHS